MNYWKLSTAILLLMMVILVGLLEVNYYQKEYEFGDFKITKPEINQMIKFQQEAYNYTDDIAKICSIKTGDCFIIGKIK